MLLGKSPDCFLDIRIPRWLDSRPKGMGRLQGDLGRCEAARTLRGGAVLGSRNSWISTVEVMGFLSYERLGLLIGTTNNLLLFIYFVFRYLPFFIPTTNP